MAISREDIDKIAKASADEISRRLAQEEQYAPYSKEGWEEHARNFNEFLAKVRAGRAKVTGAYITNPNYGGYFYKEDEKISGSVSFADPLEVLQVLETAGIKEVALGGDWWRLAGLKGWGEKVPVSFAREELPQWRAIFLGRIPARTEEGG